METPRTKASKAKAYCQGLVSEIMKVLDGKTMQKIHRDFDIVGDGEVFLDQFVEIMTSRLPNLNKKDLCELFKEIDVNGDGTLEWDELTAFIVEKSSQFKPSLETESFIVPFKFNPEQSTSKWMDDENSIHQLYYIDQLDAVAALRNHSKSVSLFDARDFSSEIGRLDGYKGIPICAEYIANKGQPGVSRITPGRLAMGCSNETICLWDLSPGELQYTIHSSWPTPHVQTSLCWVEKYDTLYSASVGGLVHAWDVEKRDEKACIFNAHDDIATCIKFLDGVDCLATGGMDAKVSIWDVHTCTKRQHLYGHNNGVTSLAYNKTHKLLVSGGVDHEAFVWSPFSPTLVYQLKGHKESLVDIACIPGSEHQILTADISGVFKVWDLRRYGCLQTFTDEAPHKLHGMTSFVACAGFDMQKQEKVGSNDFQCPYVSRIVVSTKVLHAFDQIDPVTEMVSDDIPITCALINTVSMSIITTTGKTVKIWDMFTGKQLRTYENLTDTDITTMCLDDRQRKFLLGDHSGRIGVFNYSSGALMKELDPHSAEVSKIKYCVGHKIVLSASWDRTIVLHDEMELDHGVKLREMDRLYTHTGDITCADYSNGMVATGSMDETVRVWDFDSGKLMEKLPCTTDIILVSFLPQVSGLCAADTSGNVEFWSISKVMFQQEEQIQIKHECTFKNLRQCIQRKEQETSTVLAFCWDPVTNVLVLGDEYGSLRVVSVSEKCKTIETVWEKPNVHEEGITSIDVNAKYDIIISSGFDCCVRGTSLRNKTGYGVLINGAAREQARSRYWNVPFTEEMLREVDDDPEQFNRDNEEKQQGNEDQDVKDECFDEEKSERTEEQKVASSMDTQHDVLNKLDKKTKRMKNHNLSKYVQIERGSETKQKEEKEQDSKAQKRKLIHKLISLPF